MGKAGKLLCHHLPSAGVSSLADVHKLCGYHAPDIESAGRIRWEQQGDLIGEI
jgi:hypothetical protein